MTRANSVRYRMLGSIQDAEDSLQDAMLRAWRGLPRFEGRSSLRSWLYRIATNACLDTISRRPTRTLPIDHVPASDPEQGLSRPLTESVWIEPYPDQQFGLADGLASPEARYEQREAVELAFVAAFQHLPANQRAALILCDVLGFSAREAAETLETSTAALNSALQRARETVEERLPEESQQRTLRELGDRKLREIVEKYMDAMQRGDVATVVGMLTQDAAWSMPPLPNWFRGKHAMQRFLTLGPLSGAFRWRHVPTRASGQLAVGCYTWHEDAGCYLPFCVDVLTRRGEEIEQVTAFIARSDELSDLERVLRYPDEPVDPGKLERVIKPLGLPEQLASA